MSSGIGTKSQLCFKLQDSYSKMPKRQQLFRACPAFVWVTGRRFWKPGMSHKLSAQSSACHFCSYSTGQNKFYILGSGKYSPWSTRKANNGPWAKNSAHCEHPERRVDFFLKPSSFKIIKWLFIGRGNKNILHKYLYQAAIFFFLLISGNVRNHRFRLWKHDRASFQADF